MQSMYGHKRISIWNFLTEAIAETPQHISKTFSEKWSIKKGANIFKLVETNVWAGSYGGHTNELKACNWNFTFLWNIRYGLLRGNICGSVTHFQFLNDWILV